MGFCVDEDDEDRGESKRSAEGELRREMHTRSKVAKTRAVTTRERLDEVNDTSVLVDIPPLGPRRMGLAGILSADCADCAPCFSGFPRFGL